jgi:hypothetical protein
MITDSKNKQLFKNSEMIKLGRKQKQISIMNIVFSETEERKRKNTLKNQEMKGRKSI